LIFGSESRPGREFPVGPFFFVKQKFISKLHNARAILSDYREMGDALWSRFNAGKDDQLWYYSALIQTLRAQLHSLHLQMNSNKSSENCHWSARRLRREIRLRSAEK